MVDPYMKSPGPLLIAAAAVVFASSLTVSVYTQQRATTQAHNDPPAAAPAPGPPPPGGRRYVGSEACRRCHAPIYERWSKTRMANVVTDPRQHPEVVLPDFNRADPLLTFKLDEVAFVYGSKMETALLQEGRQRLLTASGAMG